MFKPIGLGDRAKDPVTGFTGIVTCQTIWLNGCIRFGVQSEKINKDGKIDEALYFDQTQLELVKAGVHRPLMLVVAPVPERETRRSTGGPSREGPGFRR